jgi:hypothetical protein
MAGVQRYDKVVQIHLVPRFRLYNSYTRGNQQQFDNHVQGQAVGDKYWYDEIYRHQYVVTNMRRVLAGIIADWNSKSPNTRMICGVIDDLNRPPTTRFMFATEDAQDALQRNYFWHFFLSNEDESNFDVAALQRSLLV